MVAKPESVVAATTWRRRRTSWAWCEREQCRKVQSSARVDPSAQRCNKGYELRKFVTYFEKNNFEKSYFGVSVAGASLVPHGALITWWASGESRSRGRCHHLGASRFGPLVLRIATYAAKARSAEG